MRYYPQREPVDGTSEISPASPRLTVQYVAYPKAMSQLRKRLNATPEELAAWIWNGPEDGGVAAYVNANELDPPLRFHFGLCSGEGDHDYVSRLMACWFRADEIAEFTPADRYITGEALIQRWAKRPGLMAEAWVRAKIGESRLLGLHPIYGLTKGFAPEDASYPPLTTALFQVSEVEAVEAEDFPVDWDPGVGSKGDLDTDLEQKAAAQVAVATIANARAESLLAEQPTQHTRAAEVGSPAAGGIASVSPCAAFESMQNLRADELTIAFVGERSDVGLSGNTILEISARQTTRRVALAVLGLVDRRRGGPNSQAMILLGMATGRRLGNSPANAAKMKRLRDALRSGLGLVGDPFQAYRQNDGWVPHFIVTDKRGAADERAKREGERRTVSFEVLTERGVPLQSTQDASRPYDAEGDDADLWLRENDRGDSA